MTMLLNPIKYFFVFPKMEGKVLYTNDGSHKNFNQVQYKLKTIIIKKIKKSLTFYSSEICHVFLKWVFQKAISMCMKF